MKWGWLKRALRWLGDAALAKVTGAVVDRATREDEARDDPRPRCSFCGAPMVPSDLAVTGWVCVKPHDSAA
jgi:hypothetical protein